ncbi:MAG: GNAT family N-acetyltransferase [Clostridia bacterium]|nr:GNAT family N-acetyltransferase [Clostridia bacterium]
MKLSPMNEEQIKRLYEAHMRRDFPPSELKSLSSILRMVAAGCYDVLGAYQDGELAAYALVYCPRGERCVLLDYLAVPPELRGKGIGSAFVSVLRRYYSSRADVLLIECERPKTAPDESEARNRIRFYTQAGAKLTSVRIWLFEVEYSILVLPCEKYVPEKDWAEQMLSMYRQMLPAELYAQYVRLIRA